MILSVDFHSLNWTNLRNPEEVLRALEGSAITLYTHVAYHGSSLKVEAIYIRGEAPFKYYGWFGHWLECNKVEALAILTRY